MVSRSLLIAALCLCLASLQGRGAALAGAVHTAPTSALWKVLVPSNSPAHLSQPEGLAIDRRGSSVNKWMYIVDTGNNRIVKVGTGGRFLRAWGNAGPGPGHLLQPSGIAVEGDNVYIADTGNNRIEEFDAAGDFIAQWGTLGTGPGQFDMPSAVAVGGSGNVFVADRGNQRIEKFSPSGRFLAAWPVTIPPLTNPVGLTPAGPYLLVVDARGYVYTAVDTGQCSGGHCVMDYDALETLSPAGKVLSSVIGGNPYGGFTPMQPRGGPWWMIGALAVGAHGRLLLAELTPQDQAAVTEITPAARRISQWVLPKPSGDRGWPPKGMALDTRGNVYVTDTLANRVLKLSSRTSSRALRLVDQQAGSRPAATPALDYARLFGGAKDEQNARVALGLRSNVFLAGTTASPGWPVPWKTKCARQTCTHAFLLKLSPDGTHIFYALALGGSRDTTVSAIVVDSAGNAYVTGNTTSPNFPAIHPFQARCGGPAGACNDGFVAKIDPHGHVVYSTFLGGRGPDFPTAIGLDGARDVYVAGVTGSPDFPTAHATQRRLRGPSDGFVTKLAPGGRALVYSTYLGGSKDHSLASVPVDRIAGIAVDRLGEAYVTGETHSPDFRTSAHAAQPHFIGGPCTFGRCGDAFVAKLGTAGRFLAGTFLATPADESGNAIVLDGQNNVYVAGFTGNAIMPSATPMPPTGKVLCGSEGDVLPCESAFVVELTPQLDRVEYSRILAGDGLDRANTVAVNSLGNVVVGGYTESTNFPAVNPVQPKTGGGDCVEAKGGSVPCDGFIAIIGPHDSALRFSTYLGGNGQDSVDALALDGHGNAYVAGTTWSTNFPAVSPVPPALTLPKVFLVRITALYR